MTEYEEVRVLSTGVYRVRYKKLTPGQIKALRTRAQRRLQTYIVRRGLAKSFFQARQLIAHGHISIAGRKVTAPSYHVRIDDEETLDYASSSPYASKDHPLSRAMAVEEAAGGVKVEW
jgi:small subunit ribosomal protein S4